MKILFVSSVSDLEGGAERSLLELAQALRERGTEVSLAAWGSGDLATSFEALGDVSVLGTGDPASPMGGATTRLPILRSLAELLNRLRLRFRATGREAEWLVSVIADGVPDVVHTNCDLSLPAAAAAAKASGVPRVAHVRDDWRAWLHPGPAGALRSADAVIAPSSFLAGRFREHGIDPARISNPVAGRELRRALAGGEWTRIRAELAGAESASAPFLAAVVGRLDEQKGTLRIVDAAAHLAGTGEHRIRFLLAGRGSATFEAQLRRAIAARGLEGRVRLLGHRGDVPRWLPAMDALAVPSTGEPFGRMIVEGMHAGLPVVAFRDGAAPELLEHDRTGLLVPAGDGTALAAALRALAVDPDRARRLGEAARTAAEQYEPDQVAARVERLYRRLVED